MKNRKIATIGLLVALAFIFSYVEFLIPINLGVPGIKLGLANLAVIAAMYTLDLKTAFALSLIRILLVACTFGNFSGMLYSLSGGLLSFAVMVPAKRSGRFSIKGVSILGGVFHNVGQILMAMLILETSALLSYLPVLMIAGMISGLLIGIFGGMINERLIPYTRKEMTEH